MAYIAKQNGRWVETARTALFLVAYLQVTPSVGSLPSVLAHKSMGAASGVSEMKWAARQNIALCIRTIQNLLVFL